MIWHLLDLFGFQPDGLAIDEDALSLVRLGNSPLADIGSELHDGDFLAALEQDSSGLRCGGLHTHGHRQFDRM